MQIRRAIRVGLWLVLGAASGAAVYGGDPILVLPGVLLLAVAVVATRSRRVLIALPAYLGGSGLTGVVLTSTLFPNGAFSIGTSGHSAVCSSAGGCVGQAVTQSAFSVPAVAVHCSRPSDRHDLVRIPGGPPASRRRASNELARLQRQHYPVGLEDWRRGLSRSQMGRHRPDASTGGSTR